ncbi:MAG: DCC1-like thiol-disulfide oxidoreductase family protein [Marmoricola sp.]
MARVLLYDGDCGFCTRAAGWAQKIRCEVEAIPWQSWAPLASYGITPKAAAAELHLVDGGRILIGHEAIAGALLRSRYVAARLVGRVIGARVLRPLARRGYAVVAANRQSLPGGTPACASEPSSERRPA